MSKLGVVARQLRDTSAHIAQIEKEIAAHPDQRGLLINLGALEKRMRVLEAQFAELTQRDFLDICDYKLAGSPADEYQVSAVGAALVSFQHMVTVFFDSIKTGPKLKARVMPDVAKLAAMNYAYSWDGSLGFTMTVPNERMLLVGSDFDLAIERAFQVVNSRETGDIATLAKEVGVASIRSAYEWAKIHAKYQLSADVKWKRGAEVRVHTVLSADQLAAVAELIEQTSETTTEDVTLRGTLEGINLTRRQFWFMASEGEPIQGRISEGLVATLSFAHPLSIPSSVVILVRKRTRIQFSTDREEVDWELLECLAAE